MNIGELNVTIQKDWEKAGESIKQFNEAILNIYNESRLFRCLIRWDNFKFDVRQFFKDTLPLWIRFRIHKMKNPGSPWTMR